MQENLLDRPGCSEEQAEQLALESYGIAGRASRLPGERDQNFLIESDGSRYVLKLSNFGADFPFLEFENQAIRLCFALDDVVTPAIIKSIDNQSIVGFSFGSPEIQCFARCFSFVDGIPLADFQERSSDLNNRIGRSLASIDKTLKLLNHDKRARRQLKWDLSSAGNIVEKQLRFMPPENNKLLSHFLDLHRTSADRIRELEVSVIHNDANDYNWIVDIKTGPGPTAIGLIDFGDLVYAATVNDLAICCAYLMLDRDEPFTDASQIIAGYHQGRALTDREISVLFPLICLRLCQSVSIAAEQKQLRPDDDYLTVTEEPAWRLLERIADASVADITEQFSAACRSGVSEMYAADSQLLNARKQFLLPSLSLAYKRPLKIVSGRGQYLYDENDATYLDCVNNICHVGHCHPAVVKAISAQAAELNTNTRYLHSNIVQLAQQLTAKLPEPLQVCVFVNSGSEANDLALRMAINHVARQDVVVIDNAYHGHTASMITISPYKFNGPGGAGRPEHVHVLPMPDLYRGRFRYDQHDFGTRYAVSARQFIEQLADDGRAPAVFIAESLLGCAGQIPLPDGYLQNIYEAIRKYGGVCIADEVQVGFGRVGEKYWGFELQGVVPDIVTMGKPFGNGHPLAAVVTTREIAQSFDNGMEYFNSFGGNPVSCAAGSAVMDVIEREKLQENARHVGNFLISQFNRLKLEFPDRLGDVRGHGFFLGLEFVTDASSRQPDAVLASSIVETMRCRNILLSTDGPDKNVIKFKPPMVFDQANAERLVDALSRVLQNLPS